MVRARVPPLAWPFRPFCAHSKTCGCFESLCLRLASKAGVESKVLGTLAAVSGQDPLLCPRDLSDWGAWCVPLKNSPASASLPWSPWPRCIFVSFSSPLVSPLLDFLQNAPAPRVTSRVTLPIYLSFQVVKPLPAPGGLHVGWPLEEGVSEVRGAEGSGQMSSGVPGECRYLSPQPVGLDSPHLGTVAARDPTLGAVLNGLVFGKRRHLS